MFLMNTPQRTHVIEGELSGFQATQCLRKKSIDQISTVRHEIYQELHNYYSQMISYGYALHQARETLRTDFVRFMREEFEIQGKECNFYIRLWERFGNLPYRIAVLHHFQLDALQEICRKSFPCHLIDLICQELHQEPKRLTANDIWRRKWYWEKTNQNTLQDQ